jgi:hypothetical protein
MGEFPEFFGAVFNQTIERVGIVLTILPFVEKIPAVRRWLKDKTILERFVPLLWVIGLLCVVYGFFGAWQDERKIVVNRDGQITERDGQITQLKSQIDDLKNPKFFISAPQSAFAYTDKTRLTSVWLLVGISNSGAASIAGNWQLEIESPRIKTVATFSRLPQTTHSPHIQGKFNDEDAIYEKTLQKPIEKGAGVTGWAYFTIPGRVAYEELNNGAAIIHLTCYDYLNKKHTSAAFSPDSKPTTPNYFPGVRGGFHVLDK